MAAAVQRAVAALNRRGEGESGSDEARVFAAIDAHRQRLLLEQCVRGASCTSTSTIRRRLSRSTDASFAPGGKPDLVAATIAVERTLRRVALAQAATIPSLRVERLVAALALTLNCVVTAADVAPRDRRVEDEHEWSSVALICEALLSPWSRRTWDDGARPLRCVGEAMHLLLPLLHGDQVTWHDRARLVRVEWRRRQALAALTGIPVPWVMTDAQVKMLVGLMGRFPAMRRIGVRLLAENPR